MRPGAIVREVFSRETRFEVLCVQICYIGSIVKYSSMKIVKVFYESRRLDFPDFRLE